MEKALWKQIVSEFVLPLMVISTLFAIAAFWPFEMSATPQTAASKAKLPPQATSAKSLNNADPILDQGGGASNRNGESAGNG